MVVVVQMIGGATAGAGTISGEVTAAKAHWTPDGSRIVTESTVHTASGDVTVSQLGGTVDGLTMMSFPSPPTLHAGMMVDLVVHDDVDLVQQHYNVVDDVRVTYDPSAEPSGFVRTGPTKDGHYLYWESGCVFVTVDSAGTTAVADDQEFSVIDASIATWNNDTHTASCSYLQVIEDPKKPVEVGKDNTNVIKFRDTSWCRPAINGDPMRCYSPAAAGITTATFVDDATSSRDGAIVDADIEINGVNFAISVNGQTNSQQPCHAELQNTMTHELGHLHGLEHTCLAAGDPPRVDNNGNPVPSCSGNTDPAIVNATMYNFQDCGETKKETLDPDDENAICVIYPVAKDPMTCARVGSGSGCCDAGGDPRGAAIMTGIIGLLLRRTRTRARTRSRRAASPTL
ncbi:MAG: hypothetical protein ACM31C_33070 [Acidobacteriota bacterium]